MKRSFYALGLMLAATFTLTNCAEEIDAPVQEPSANVPFEIVASTVDTKTANDGLNTVWVEGDAINLFHAEAGGTAEYVNNASFTVTDLETGVFEGTLAGTLTEGVSYDWYAMYPYSKYVEAPNGIDYSYVGNRNGVTQNGYNSKAHLSGSNCSLYGVVKSVAAGERPVVTMHHLTSVIAITINNVLENTPLTVTSVSFTAPEDIVGSYYIDFASDQVSYTGSGESYVNSTASATVTNGTELNYRENATVYIPIKPFTAKTGDVLKISVNGYEKELELESDVEFVAGNIKPMTFYFDQVPVFDLPYEETFSSSLGAFTAEGEIPEGLSYVWAFDSSYGAKASAYANSTKYAQESYLISPRLSLENVTNAKMSFDHAGNYFGTKTDEATVWARVVEGDVIGEWEQLPLHNYFSGFTFVPSYDIDLSAYAGKIIQIGFKYVSTTSAAGTWEIKNLVVEEGVVASVINGTENPETIAAEGAEVVIPYSIVNPVEGVSLTASTETEWITDIDCSVEGEVSFTVAANDGSSRSGVVTLSYAGAEDVDVVVSQSPSPDSGEVTVVTTIGDLGLTNSQKYTTIELDGVITATAAGGSNTGKYYSNGSNWRFYQTESPSLTISADAGYTIKSVKITYAVSNTGILTYNGSNITSGTVVDVNASSITFGVGNSGTATNGQVRVTEIEVVYQAD